MYLMYLYSLCSLWATMVGINDFDTFSPFMKLSWATDSSVIHSAQCHQSPYCCCALMCVCSLPCMRWGRLMKWDYVYVSVSIASNFTNRIFFFWLHCARIESKPILDLRVSVIIFFFLCVCLSICFYIFSRVAPAIVNIHCAISVELISFVLGSRVLWYV